MFRIKQNICVKILCLYIAFLSITVIHRILIETEQPWTEHPLIIYWPQIENNIACHDTIINDALPSVDDRKFSPKRQSIFFHETSCRGGINSRQACAVESAARAHPKREVYLLFNSPVSAEVLKKSCLTTLLAYPNVKMARIHSNTFSNNTAVHYIVMENLRTSLYPVEHTADIIKIVTLNKWGGVYLDLDVVVARSFDSLAKNWIAKESSVTLSAGAMAFSKHGIGHNVTSEILKVISQTFDPNDRLFNGEMAIRQALLKRCKDTVAKSGDCKGLKIYRNELFYPLYYAEAYSLFNEGTIVNVEVKPYIYHMWNVLTKTTTVQENSPYAQLAKMYCPKIYELYGPAFGV